MPPHQAPMDEALAYDTAQSIPGAIFIVATQLFTVVIAELKFCHIAMTCFFWQC